MDGERITLRMETEDVHYMDEYLQEHPEVSNRSQLIRIALRNYMERDAPAGQNDTLSIKVGDRFMKTLTKLCNGGFAETEEEVAMRIIERFLMPKEVFEDAAKEAFKSYDSYAEIAKR